MNYYDQLQSQQLPSPGGAFSDSSSASKVDRVMEPPGVDRKENTARMSEKSSSGIPLRYICMSAYLYLNIS